MGDGTDWQWQWGGNGSEWGGMAPARLPTLLLYQSTAALSKYTAKWILLYTCAVFFSSTEAEIKAIYSLTYPGWNGKKERNPAFVFIKNSQAQPVRCWDIRHQKVQIGCIAFAAFKPDPDPIAKKVDTRPKPASCLSDVDVSTLLQLSIKFQVCFHSRSHICLSCPPCPLFLANTEKSCLELWLGSSAVHEKCIHSALFRSLRLWYSCHIISMPCHVSACINYVAGGVEETILMHLN